MYFTLEKIENQLKEICPAMYRGVCDIPRFKFYEGEIVATGQGPECPEFDDRSWREFRVGETWGGYDVVAWFRAWVTVPPDWKGHKLALRFLAGPRDGGGSTAEGLLFVNGSALQAVDVWHTDAWLPPELATAGRLFLALKCWSGVIDVPARRHFKLAQLAWVDEPTEAFYHLASAVLNSVKTLDEHDLRRVRLTQVLNEAFHRIDFIKPGAEAFYVSLRAAYDYLQAEVGGLSQLPELKPHVTGVGHAHIDMAWLWRLRHTREKVARTFSTALHLMRQYPAYRFMHSSPQAYKFLKQDYPEIFARVKERIAAGQWEVTGGMWVEADTNLTGGESLVRQFLLGRRFVREEFGVEMNTLWLPDVFGYSAALPQIARKSGMKYFLTTKISWNQYNRFPYDTFAWRGIDGSELLTHFVTTPEENSRIYTYNGVMSPAQVQGLWENYRQKDLNDDCLMLFGWGDGGGGPTREMLESAQTLENLPGMPSVSLGTAEDYLARLERRLAGKPLPVWDGELYLEYHRGTYTSQAYNKRANRKAEILYHNTEWLSSLADILTGEANYPARLLQAGWETLLLNQFHDILPGSSIHQVYEDCHEDYDRIQQIGAGALEQAQQAIVSKLPAGPEGVVVMNSLSWPRSGLFELPWSETLAGKTIIDANGCPSAVQVIESAGERRLLLEAVEVPALGYRRFPLAARYVTEVVSAEQTSLAGVRAGSRPQPAHLQAAPLHDDLMSYPIPKVEAGSILENELAVTPDRLENRFYRITLNERGQISGLYDKRHQRDVLAAGAAGNVFQAFEDKPMNFDAWDIDLYYEEKMRPVENLVSAQVEEAGPLRGALRLTWRFFDSTISQRIVIYRSSPRIDFETEIDWHEQQVLMKVAFPLNVRATRATYEIQFGSLERPTHRNTSWDAARFEVAGHKWADLSEGNYGVSLLNDCKYGYDARDNVLRLTLLKSAISPDRTADQGRHLFIYSLLPHAGDWRQGDVIRQAYDLNVPLLAVQPEHTAAAGADLPMQFSLASLDSENVILETVKQAEDGDGWVVRVYEAHQSRSGAVRIRFGRPLAKAVECNLVEEDERPADFSADTLIFAIDPFEIKTFKIWFSK